MRPQPGNLSGPSTPPAARARPASAAPPPALRPRPRRSVPADRLRGLRDHAPTVFGRLVLALVAVHALRPLEVTRLPLEDLSLDGGRLTVRRPPRPVSREPHPNRGRRVDDVPAGGAGCTASSPPARQRAKRPRPGPPPCSRHHAAVDVPLVGPAADQIFCIDVSTACRYLVAARPNPDPSPP